MRIHDGKQYERKLEVVAVLWTINNFRFIMLYKHLLLLLVVGKPKRHVEIYKGEQLQQILS